MASAGVLTYQIRNWHTCTVQQLIEHEELIGVLQRLTRDLVGVAVESLDAVSDIGLAHMRLLFAVHDEPWQPCTYHATSLGISASSVTRQADRLCGSGHLTRRLHPDSRRMVVLELTERGQQAIDSVLAHRAATFTEALRRMRPDARAATLAGLVALHDAFAHLAAPGPAPAGDEEISDLAGSG